MAEGFENMRSMTIPDATKATLHPIVEAAERHVHSFLKRWPITSGEARKMVRVEITHAARDDLCAHFSVGNPYLVHDPRQTGPMQIMGVSYYVVDTLPEPGWRVLP